MAKKINSKNDHLLFWGIIGGSYFILFYFAQLLELQIIFYVQIAYAILFGTYVLLFNTRKKIPFVIGVILVVIGQIIMTLRQFPSGIPSTYQEIIFMLMGLVFCVKKMDIRILNICYYTISALITLRLSQNFYVLFLVPETDKMNFFANASVNYISVFLLVMIGVICYQAKIQNKPMPPLLALIALVLSFLSKSRMGMLTTIILLFIVSNKGKITFKYIFRSIIIVSFSFVALYFVLTFAFNRFGVDGLAFLTEKFETRSSTYQEDARFELLTGYLGGLNMVTLFTGVDIAKIPIYAYLDNTHNTFLYMHYHYGIVALVIIFLLIKTFFYLLKRDRFLCLVFALLLLRGFTDDVFFVKNYDIVIIMYMLTPYYSPLFKNMAQVVKKES